MCPLSNLNSSDLSDGPFWSVILDVALFVKTPYMGMKLVTHRRQGGLGGEIKGEFLLGVGSIIDIFTVSYIEGEVVCIYRQTFGTTIHIFLQ